MSNVFCDLCHKEVGHDDSFVVADAPVVMAFHYSCGHKIQAALSASIARDRKTRPVEQNTNAWTTRDLEERVSAAEEQLRNVVSVWRLWLNDARRGAINPGTFDTMRTLLGMAHHE